MAIQTPLPAQREIHKSIHGSSPSSPSRSETKHPYLCHAFWLLDFDHHPPHLTAISLERNLFVLPGRTEERSAGCMLTGNKTEIGVVPIGG